jgi:hypothetical protein
VLPIFGNQRKMTLEKGRVIPTAVDPDFCATVWTGSRHACPGHLRYGGQYAEMAWTPEAGAWP